VPLLEEDRLLAPYVEIHLEMEKMEDVRISTQVLHDTFIIMSMLLAYKGLANLCISA
jgi:hypothetical protein